MGQKPSSIADDWRAQLHAHPPKWAVGQHLKHSGGSRYAVVGLPTQFCIEATGEPAYAYQEWDKIKKAKVGPIYIRSQAVMEGGRFTPLPSTYADLYGPDYSWVV